MANLSFDELLQRIHPAASRVKMLSEQYPCVFIVFDLLVNEQGVDLTNRPLEQRRRELERWAKKFLRAGTDRAIACHTGFSGSQGMVPANARVAGWSDREALGSAI